MFGTGLKMLKVETFASFGEADVALSSFLNENPSPCILPLHRDKITLPPPFIRFNFTNDNSLIINRSKIMLSRAILKSMRVPALRVYSTAQSPPLLLKLRYIL